MFAFLDQSPFLLPLLAAVIARLCAILFRRAAGILKLRLWWPANIFAFLSACFLTLSFYWAMVLSAVLPLSARPGAVFGNLIIIGGVLLALWGSMELGAATFICSEEAPLVVTGPYALFRRPIDAGVLVIGIGAALSQANIDAWTWLLLWLPCSLLLSELEEWELRGRISEAAAYFLRTPRYIPWLRSRASR
ncbi:MAG: hypothetical protein JXA97_02955 [Anaerolineales bacterium]|nr:hypothetical protein [Anaerolineales bacterium]